MNNTYHPLNQSGDESRRNGNASSRAHASAKALEVEAKISMLKAIRVRMPPKYGSPFTALSQNNATADAEAREGSDMQILHVPTKTEDSQPGTTLNPASCASGLALLGGGGGGGGEGSDWNSALSLTTLIERRMRGDQGNNRRPNSSLQNEDWDDLHLPQAQGNLFLGDGDN
eukprot:scaffold39652_cov211-Skeletonema_dohrnii-CCMP3373.AAC.1